MRRYEPVGGETIDITAEKLVRMANTAKEPVTTNFNNVEITAKPGDNADTIVQNFRATLKLNKKHP